MTQTLFRRLRATAGSLAAVMPVLVTASCGMAVHAAPARGQIEYTIEDLGAGQALAINDAGQVAGTRGTYPGVDAVVWKRSGIKVLGSGYAYAISEKGRVAGQSGGEAVVWWNGKRVDLGALPAMKGVPLKVYDSLACGVNDKGQVVGITDFESTEHGSGQDAPNFFPHVFLYDNGELLDLGDSSESSSAAINANGQIACNLGDSAVLWTSGLRTSLSEPLNYTHLSVESINNAGAVAGSMDWQQGGSTSSRAFVSANGYTLDIGTLGGRNSMAFCVNDHGQVVGTSATRSSKPRGPDGPRHAFVWQDGRMQDLNAITPNDTGWVLVSANAINNEGQIAGYGMLNGVGHAFLLQPGAANHKE